VLLHVINFCAEIPFLLLGIVCALDIGVLPAAVEIMMATGGVLIVVLVMVLWLVQHYRFVSRIGRWLSRAWFGVAALRVVRHIRAIEGRLMEFYLGQPRRFFAACALQFCNWCMGAVEIYLVLHFLDAPILFIYALVIESVVVLVRTALFFIPSNIGAQEGTFLVVCGAITGSPELGVAVALIRRFRELFWISLGLLIGWGVSLKPRLAVAPDYRPSDYNGLDRKLDRGHMASGR
jgi:glycosyltransferase 2 family protein